MNTLSNASIRSSNRYFDRKFGCDAVKILPGECEVTVEDIMIVTVLGSCVSACVSDRHPRKVYYFPRTGRVLVKKLKQVHNDTILQREQDYSTRLKHRPATGEIGSFLR